MRGKPGYEHLNEPLHILVEAELPIEIVDARLMVLLYRCQQNRYRSLVVG